MSKLHIHRMDVMIENGVSYETPIIHTRVLLSEGVEPIDQIDCSMEYGSISDFPLTLSLIADEYKRLFKEKGLIKEGES